MKKNQLRVEKLPEDISHADLKQLNRLDAIGFPDSSPFDFLKEDIHIWKLVKKNRKDWVGFGALDMSHDNSIEPFLARGAIDPQFRGQKLQRKLIMARVNYAKKLGVEAVQTNTYADNYPSANNIIACGFKLFYSEVYKDEGMWLWWRKKFD